MRGGRECMEGSDFCIHSNVLFWGVWLSGKYVNQLRWRVHQGGASEAGLHVCPI